MNFYPYNNTPNGFQIYSMGPDGRSAMISTSPEVTDNIANFSS